MKFNVIFVILAITLATAPLAAQQENKDIKLFSSSVADIFHEMALEITSDEHILQNNIDQGLLFYNAALVLNNKADTDFIEDMIIFASQDQENDNTDMLKQLLKTYVKKRLRLGDHINSSQIHAPEKNTREEREALIVKLFDSIGEKNQFLDSELLTLYGLFRVETGDFETAANNFLQAYDQNPYNSLAFEKLSELIADKISPENYLVDAGLQLRENPINLQAALVFAERSKNMQLYDISSQTFQYCSELYRYLNPEQTLPPEIYIPLAQSLFNTDRDKFKCLQLASEVSDSGRFDIYLQSTAALAAKQLNRTDQYRKYIDRIEKESDRVLALDSTDMRSMLDLAWFYCFVKPDPNNALNIANKAFSEDTNQPVATSLLAYSLVMNSQDKWAEPLIKVSDGSQIAALAQAKILLNKSEKDDAITKLKNTIDIDPSSIIAFRAKEMLEKLNSQYIAPFDSDVIINILKQSFGAPVIAKFKPPQQLLSLQINTKTRISYESAIPATISIINNSSNDMVVTDKSLFRGNIRIDAKITGDIKKEIASLFSIRVRPGFAIKPQAAITKDIDLMTGELKNILLQHPQASLNIELITYIDPVVDINGNIENSYPDIPPAVANINRQKVDISTNYLKNRIESIRTGKSGQKILTAKLFAGLLLEQQIMANRDPLYKFVYASWMPKMLKASIINAMEDKDWITKVHILAAIKNINLDYDLVSAVSQNLNDSRWPVRMIAIYLLAKNQGQDFQKVVDWSAKYDSSEFVRKFALTLGADEPNKDKNVFQSIPEN